MISRCQSRFAFSKVEWYTSALRALARNEALNVNSTRSVSAIRPFATLASTVVDPKLEEMSTAAVTHITPIPPIMPSSGIQPSAKLPLLPAVTNDYIYHRCSGFKKLDGRRCTRLVRVNRDIASVQQEYYYCYHHDPEMATKRKKNKSQAKRTITSDATNGNTETPLDVALQKKNAIKLTKSLPAKKIYDCWDLWISPRIDESKRKLIKQEMERPLSERDKPGYIYAYQLAEGRLSTRKSFAYFKIGRTTDPHRRMYQIANSCDLVPRIIELFPSFPKTDRPLMPTNLEPLEEKLLDLPKCPVSHRVERLIHLELLGLCNKAQFKCPKCGTKHREWFKIRRNKMPDGKLMTDQQLYLLKIRPIILKWIQFGVAASVFLPNNKPIPA